MRNIAHHIFIALLLLTSLPIAAETTFEKGALYIIRSKKNPEAVIQFIGNNNGCAVQLSNDKENGANYLWNISGLSPLPSTMLASVAETI